MRLIRIRALPAPKVSVILLEVPLGTERVRVLLGLMHFVNYCRTVVYIGTAFRLPGVGFMSVTTGFVTIRRSGTCVGTELLVKTPWELL